LLNQNDIDVINSIVSRLYKKKLLDKQIVASPNYGKSSGNKFKFIAGYSICK